MEISLYFFIFLFGLVIGSFLNCVIYRLALPNFSFRKNLGGLKNISYCPECEHKLAWYDLIPVFSYFWLKGKCRYCKRRISIQYPAVEIATVLVFLLVVSSNLPEVRPPLVSGGLTSVETLINIFYLLIIFSLLLIIFVYDLRHYIIPDKIVFPAILIVLLYNLVFNPGFLFSNALWAGLLPALFFFALFFFSKGKWLGFGDVKLALFMGLFLGLPNILVALFLAVFFGGIMGLGLIIFGKKSLKSEMPFGPFLAIGTLIAMLYGNDIINWYLNISLK